MDFSSITSVNSFVKLTALKNTFQQKTNNPESAIPGDSSSIHGGEQCDGYLSSIVAKMQTGEDLSPGELEYLRGKYPDIYAEAVKLSKEKKEYEESLNRCGTKDEARMLQMSKVAEAFSAVKSAMARSDVAACITANARLRAMTMVYCKFTKTSEYDDMAENYAELDEALRAIEDELAGIGPEDIDKDVMVESEDDIHKDDVTPKDLGSEDMPELACTKEIEAEDIPVKDFAFRKKVDGEASKVSRKYRAFTQKMGVGLGVMPINFTADFGDGTSAKSISFTDVGYRDHYTGSKTGSRVSEIITSGFSVEA